MGFRFGEHRYSEGRYSRWPDWWHDKTCLHDQWTTTTCDRPGYGWSNEPPHVEPHTWVALGRRKKAPVLVIKGAGIG